MEHNIRCASELSLGVRCKNIVNPDDTYRHVYTAAIYGGAPIHLHITVDRNNPMCSDCLNKNLQLILKGYFNGTSDS